jgi:hypothetical protein
MILGRHLEKIFKNLAITSHNKRRMAIEPGEHSK